MAGPGVSTDSEAMDNDAAAEQDGGEGKQIADTVLESVATVAVLSARAKRAPKPALEVTTALRVSNNDFSSLANLHKSLAAVVFMPEKLLWLDLSFNMLSTMGAIAQACPALKLLYLHTNQIDSMAEVDTLRGLQELQTLTLHGNPIENVEGYRFRAAAALPGLRKLDFSALTLVEQDKARVWRESPQIQKKMHFTMKNGTFTPREADSHPRSASKVCAILYHCACFLLPVHLHLRCAAECWLRLWRSPSRLVVGRREEARRRRRDRQPRGPPGGMATGCRLRRGCPLRFSRASHREKQKRDLEHTRR
jgi:hypothetical protein